MKDSLEDLRKRAEWGIEEAPQLVDPDGVLIDPHDLLHLVEAAELLGAGWEAGLGIEDDPIRVEVPADGRWDRWKANHFLRPKSEEESPSKA